MLTNHFMNVDYNLLMLFKLKNPTSLLVGLSLRGLRAKKGLNSS